jgi:tRNA(Ile)-lysidine synthetase-like protein
VLVGRVRRTLLERDLIPVNANAKTAESRVLCACSGGPDSASLLACLAQLAPELGFALEAASVDHGLRAEAAEDVAIAAQQAAQLGVAFHALKLAVEPGRALQARAREQRYAALHALATRVGANCVAVGHTRDDQAETVIARLLRGAGVRGLGGIQPRREDGVVRPLIDCMRADVHRYARATFERIAEDRSNVDPHFERVRIRSHVLPNLAVEDRALVRHLAELADDARAYGELADALADTFLRHVTEKSLAISELAALKRAVRQAVLRAWVHRSVGLSLGRAELSQLELSIRQRRGEVWLAKEWCICAGRDGFLHLRTRAGQGG